MRRQRAVTTLWAGVAGVVSAGVFLAAAELVALVAAPSASPILAVGSFVIDIVPRPLKEFAISTFGDADKPVLLASLAVAVVIGAAIAGVLELMRRFAGAALLVLAGLLAGAAILTRAGAGPLSALPPLAGIVAGAVVLVLTIDRLRRWRTAAATVGVEPNAAEPAADAASASPPERPRERAKGPDRIATTRRGFFQLTLVAAAAAVVVGTGARVVSAATSAATAVREALRLPSPRSTVTVPAGAELDVAGISPLYTPNEDFYRVDTALTVPTVDPSTWSLVIDGMVDQRVELSFDDLVGMGLDEYSITLTCVSNEVGGNLVGSAIWQGVPVRDLLALAGPQSGADMVLSRSVDGFTASTPLEALTDDSRDAILAVAMNGEPLPLEHGFPVRMVVPGLYGYVSATKWLSQLTVTTFAQDEAYWTPRGYSAEAPIKMSSRIDTPRTDSAVTAGTVAVAGVAWAQHTGIERVEVSIDDGEWQEATLSTPVNADTWVQWMLEWNAEPGTHFIEVRAIDADGNAQVEERAPIAPDGSTGLQRMLVTVR